MDISPEDVLKEASDYVKNRKKVDWFTYEHFKKKVGEIDMKLYDIFLAKLIDILKV